MQEKLREMDLKRTTHIARLEAQRKTIKEMEVEILKENSYEYLEQMKARIFKPANVERDDGLSPSRSIIDIENEAAKEESRVSRI